ncbi:MAG: AAA family ATPase, partial [Chloroflexi bacterium]|nr:AAA family ATPase [Chloroflexota bacterium]
AALTDVLQRTLAVAPLPETIARYEALLAGTPHIQPPAAPRAICHEPSAPLIGRQAELAILAEEQSLAAQSSTRVVLISGDLGIGKSRLWQSWAATLPAETVVLATHALETDQPVPFGPLVSLFRHCGPAQAILQPPSALAPIWLSELSRLLPEIAATWPDLPPPLRLAPAEERPRLFQALTEALRLLVSPLLVLVLDDLHWADPSTLDWLVYMLDQLRGTSLLLVGTYRQQDASEQLLAVIAGWQRQGMLRQIVLPPLTADESEALLTALDTAETTREHWVKQSGGNPYFLIELSRGADGEPSSDLTSLIRTRLRTTVPASAYQVLQAAAVLGDGIDLGLLHATSGRPEEDLLDALDALVGAAVLVEQSGSYQFVQPLVGAVVLQDLTAARRSFLHRRAAQALERAHARQPERVAQRLMEHFAAAGEIERAAHYADLAAQRALAIGSFTEAAAYARQALDWQPTPSRRLLLGRVLLIASDAGEARAQLEQAFTEFEQSRDAVGATRAGVMLAQMAIGISQPDLARSWLARVPIERAQTIDPAVVVHARLLAAGVDRFSQAFDDAEAQLDLVDQLLQDHDLPFEASQSAFERGNVLANRGELRAAIPAYEQALRIAEASGNPQQQMLAHNNLAYHLMLLGDLDPAQEHIRVAQQLSERFALGVAWQYVYSTLGEIMFALGKLDEADAAFERALEAATAWHNAVQIANLRVNQALVARARNDLPRAHALLDEAQTTFGTAVEPYVRDKILRYRAEILGDQDPVMRARQ